MKTYEFGDENKPVILLLPGTCCHWKATFGEVIPLLERRFYVAYGCSLGGSFVGLRRYITSCRCLKVGRMTAPT